MDTSTRQALIQYFETDRLLGLRDVPIVLEAPSARPPIAAKRLSDVPAAELAARTERLRVLDTQQVKPCVKCGLARTRTQTVFGQGNPAARLVFVGEAPGYEEDKQGLAFVGAAGQLLTKMIEAGMGLRREDVFICNVIKCRPPDNRTPATDEIAACSPYLYEQLSTIQPEVIVALGAPAAKTLLHSDEPIGKLRGRWHEFHLSSVPGSGPSVPLMPTYHPAYLLRTPSDKAKTWADLQIVMQRLGLPLPRK